MIGKAIALYALWRCWRTRNAPRSLLSMQAELNALRARRREAVATIYGDAEHDPHVIQVQGTASNVLLTLSDGSSFLTGWPTS